MITRILLITLCIASIVPTKSAGTKKSIDCKKIDQKKFKEIFPFKFGGGQAGLYLDFGFGPNPTDLKFKVENCDFLLHETKTKAVNEKSHSNQLKKKSLGGLKPCTKYDVTMKVQNVATNKNFTYQNNVFTKVDFKVAKLALKLDKLQSDSASLSWNLAGPESCIKSYKVDVNNGKENSVVIVKDKNVVIKNISSCDIYTAKVTAETTRDETIVSSEITFNLSANGKDSKVEKLQLNIDEVTKDSAALSWTSDSENCLQQYQLKLRDTDDKIVYEKNVFKTSTVITDLTSCNNYSVELIALSSEKLSLKAVIKSFITLSAPINNVTVTVKKSQATVSWIPPTKLDCILNFNVSYNILDCSEPDTNCSASMIIDKTKASAKFSSLPLAERFSLTFYANEVTSSGEDARHAKKLPFNTIDYDKFVVRNINEFRLKRTELQVRWGVDLFLTKFVRHYEVFFDDKVLTTNNPVITLNVAACQKNYKIAIRCVSTDGYQGANITYQTNLNDDDVPLSSLENNIQYKQMKESVIISWAPIKEEESCIGYYEIHFNDQMFKTNKTRTEINDFAPCITYEIDITPISHHGNAGTRSTFEFTSEEFLPKTPTKLQLIEAGNKEMKLSTTISEDDKQCNSTAIEFTCNDVTVVVNVELLNSEYVGKLTGLHPFMKYNCSAKVRNNVGISESTDVAVFHTKQDAPQPPTHITSQVSGDNSVELEWVADNSTGFAKTFKVHVTFENSIYETVNGCDPVQKKKLSFEATESRIQLNNLEPYSQYSVKIESRSEYGISDQSRKHSFTTKLSEASSPRDVFIDFSPNDDNQSLVVGTLNWSPPCHPNGRIEFYTIKLNGRRGSSSDVSRTEVSFDTKFSFIDLKRGFEYEFEVKAKNAEFYGEAKKFSFKTPSGIPLEEDLEDWTLATADAESFNNGRGEIFLRRGTFFSEVGEITGIAFLVFLANCPSATLPQPTSGFLSSLTNQLPSSHEVKQTLECFNLYQQTEILPNPAIYSNESNMNDYSIKFTIGGEICSNLAEEKKYCNGRLAAYTKYGIMARIFTENGFRDTNPVYVQIDVSPMELISPKTIVFGSVSLLIFVSLIILLCCVKNGKKKKKIIKEKEAAEADENLLSFTSYCVIDKNPLPRKSYND